MVLVIDVGNTNITLGLYKDDKLIESWRLTTKIARTEDELWGMVKVLFESANLKLDGIHGIAMGSVVPSISISITRLIEKRIRVNFVEVSSKSKTGIVNRYADPSSVGADRLCDAVAGYEKYGGPLIIIDFGTATTFNVISEHAEYLGGIIAPGLETTMNSLHRLAAKLPMVELKFPQNLIGQTTESSMQSGLMYGGAVMVEGLLQRLKKELGVKTKIIATGGLAPVLLPELPSVEHIEPNLTLDGLYKIYQKNAR